MALSLFWCFAVSAVILNWAEAITYRIPNSVFDGISKAEISSVPGNLDGQKVTPYPNASSYEW